MKILGISCDYHDAAAALVVDGEIVAAAEEERFSRVKHDASLPANAVEACLEIGGIGASDLEAVVLHEKPLMVASRVLAARQRRGPAALGSFVSEMPTLLGTNLMIAYRVEKLLRRLGAKRPPKLQYCDHHTSHAAAAFFPSPFRSAAILTIDGIGEWSTVTVSHGSANRLEQLAEQRYPNSYGLLYSLLTAWCGFAPNDGEYKLMGLAPFGEPRFRDALNAIAPVDERGALRIDTKAVRGFAGKPKAMKRLVDAFEGPPLRAGEAPTQREADLARSVQELIEDSVLAMAADAYRRTDEDALCLAGGVALNCVANSRLLRDGPFERLWVQPAAGDAGSAVGAALWRWFQLEGAPRHREGRGGQGASDVVHTSADAMRGSYLGPDITDEQAEAALAEAEIDSEVLDDDALAQRVAALLADGNIVGWARGRMEFGPRALGARSILADPRSPTVQRTLNVQTKGRESFRPFAPAVLAESAAEWFDGTAGADASPYMLVTFPVAASHLVSVDHEPTDFIERVSIVRSEIPACTHIDGSARVQTVDGQHNPVFRALIEAFAERTGVPVLLNTSFNRAGEPIVCTAADAISTARHAQLDVLVLGNHLAMLAKPQPEPEPEPDTEPRAASVSQPEAAR